MAIYHRVKANDMHPLKKLFERCRHLQSLSIELDLDWLYTNNSQRSNQQEMIQNNCMREILSYLNTRVNVFESLEGQLSSLRLLESAAICSEGLAIVSRFAPTLQNLQITSTFSFTFQIAHRMWYAVQECAQLRKLAVGFQNS